MEIKILIIDDDQNVGDLVSAAAELEEVSSHALLTSLSLQAVNINDFNLLFLDLMMPDRDGIETLRDLLEMNYRGHIVLMSGFDNSVLGTAKELAEEHGLHVLKTLNKPFRITDISEIIAEAKSLKKAEHNHAAHAKVNSLHPAHIESAIEEKRLEIHYQPQVDLITHRLIGVEALVRIRSNEGELIYPDRFIEVAEKNKLIQSLTKSVIELALRDFTELHGLYNKLTLSINLSTQDLDSLDFIGWLESRVKEVGISTGKIILEVTETEQIWSYSNALEVLSRLRLKGFKMSIDDFGTGNAVLEQIKRLPATELKIDRTFVNDIQANHKSLILIKNTVNMCRELDLDVVVEGIENQETENLLLDLGCKIGQGYLYSKPLPFAEIKQLIEERISAMPIDTLCISSIDEGVPVQVKIDAGSHFDKQPLDMELPEINSAAAKKAVLGFIVPLTGQFTFIGTSQKVGAELAFHAYRHGDLAIRFFDDESNLDNYLSLVKVMLPKNTMALMTPAFAINDLDKFIKGVGKHTIPVIAPFNGSEALRTASATPVFNIKPGFDSEFKTIIESLDLDFGTHLCILPSTKTAQVYARLCEQTGKIRVLGYKPSELDNLIRTIKQVRPQSVIFVGAARTLIRLIEGVNDNHVHYYATSLVGVGVLKQVLARRAKLKLTVSEPMLDYQSDASAAVEFRAEAAKMKAPLKYLNSISFESYLATKLVLELCEKENVMNAVDLCSKLEKLYGYDLGIDTPLTWNQDKRQLTDKVHLIDI